MNQIQIPSGMRDLFPADCAGKEKLRAAMLAVYRSYGYRMIETPLIEYYSTYQNTFSSLAEETLYKFVDESGQILALRTDMTLPIARVCATKFASERPPFRFAYCSNVYKVRQAFAGKRNEVTDCGVELIGLDASSDLEVLCCALDVMRSWNIEQCVLEIGNSDFYKLAARQAGLDEETTKKLADLIDRKALPETADLLKEISLPEEQAEFFRRLPLMNGRNALQEAYEYSFSEELKGIIAGLCELKKDLEDLGYGQMVSFDLGKVPHLDYYTGIIFEGYVQGIGTSVLSGGRYDDLLRKLGRDLPAIGFGVKLDVLLDAVRTEETPVRKLYYKPEERAEAMRKAQEMRREGPVELIPERSGS